MPQSCGIWLRSFAITEQKRHGEGIDEIRSTAGKPSVPTLDLESKLLVEAQGRFIVAKDGQLNSL